MRGFTLLLITLLVFGCGTSRKKWVMEHCSPKGSHKIGLNDAKHKRRSGITALKQKCPSEKTKMALANYEKGFKAGGGKVGEKYKYGQDLLQDVVKVMDDESQPTKSSKKKSSKTGNESQ